MFAIGIAEYNLSLSITFLFYVSGQTRETILLLVFIIERNTLNFIHQHTIRQFQYEQTNACE